MKFILPLVVMLFALAIVEDANAQCNNGQCSNGQFLVRTVPQMQFQPGNFRVEYRQRPTLVNLFPWNWGRRVVCFRRQMIFQPSGPWKNAGTCNPQPARINPITPRTIHYVLD